MLSRNFQRTTLISRRFSSTLPSVPARGTYDPSHALAGLAGGSVVLAGLYGYYHYSGTAEVISSSKSIINLATKTKDKIANATPDRSQALSLLKSGVKYYSAAVPGSDKIIDSSFEKLESVLDKEGEKLTQIYEELLESLYKSESTGEDIIKAIINSATKFSELGGAGQVGEWMSKLTEGNEDLKKLLGNSGEDLGELAKKYGPEAQKIASDSFDQAKNLLKEGGLNEKTYNQVSKLIKEKKEEIVKLGKNSGAEFFDLGSKQFAPILQKIPDLKNLVESNIGKVEGLLGEEKSKFIKRIYSELEKLSQSEKSAEEISKAAKEMIEKRFGEFDFGKAKDLVGGDGMIDKAGSMIGISGLSKMLGADEIEHLKKLAMDESAEGKKLLESTYAELKAVLGKKMEEGKKIVEGLEKEVEKKK